MKLASETFNYLRIDIEKSKAKKIVNEHFPKVGRRFHRLGQDSSLHICLQYCQFRLFEKFLKISKNVSFKNEANFEEFLARIDFQKI